MTLSKPSGPGWIKKRRRKIRWPARQQIEQVPNGAEIIVRARRGVVHTDHAIFPALKDR
jgi:hypothetical protein